MRLYIKCILFLYLPVCMAGQEVPEWKFISKQEADSLRNASLNVKNDTLRMSACRSLGFYFQEINRDSALYYHQKQLVYAQNLHLKIWEADAYNQIGDDFGKLDNYQAALESFQKGIALVSDPANEKINWRIQSFSNSKTLHEARLSVLGMIYNDMSAIYADVNETEKQRSSLLKSIEIGENIQNGKILSLANGNLATISRPDSAIHYLRIALAYADESGFKKYYGAQLFGLAAVYHSMNRGDSAFIYLKKAIQAHTEQNNYIGLIFCLDQLARAYTTPALNNPDSSLYYANKVYNLAVITSSPDQLLIAYNTLSYVNNFLNRIDSAYKYEMLAAKLNDSLKNNTIGSLTGFYKFSMNEQQRLKEQENKIITYQNRLKITVLITGLFIFLLIGLILFRNNRQKQKANAVLEKSLSDLKATQTQLIQSEKMASLGELTAGIAHEIQNPLNFVNNFSEVSNELLDEMKSELEEGDVDEAKVIAADVKQNLEKILHHGKRADGIVKGMLQHSRGSSGTKEPTDINVLCDEYLRLSYHGLRAKDKSFNATMKMDFDETIGNINIVPQDIGRVVLNLINNAFFAVSEKQKTCQAEAVEAGYEPTLIVSTKKLNGKVEITVKDNGNGIPESIKEKIFQPFFTTKPTGQGTGLGLSLSYDIVKAHGGEFTVETKENEGSAFTIKLPIA